ncbi:glycosyltransferase [Pedobacter sp. D749]|uniref:glycosyltransferase family 2 protein n=1 Tax=Pedobacter sp. D749 TaxID=2856523 RepID=UPI001C56D21C|nr:glycosyltransferase [Pedobacter sp. D749]QXU42333.1 glycosyltransferase [Pedobacter sp. D749]
MPQLVSIIIPTFNSANFIEACIKSALNQSYPYIEVIVVDDGSEDNSFELAQRYVKLGVKVFKQINKGASAARNFGLKHANGTYIQFLDADDLLAENKIELQMRELLKHPNSISFGDCINFKISPTAKHNIVNSHIARKIKFIETPKNFIKKLYGVIDNLPAGMVEIHSWLCPKNIIENAGRWNETLSVDDDGDFFLRVILKAKKVIYVPESLVYYRKHEFGSLSNANGRKNIAASIKSVNCKAETLIGYYPNDMEFKTMISDAFWQLAVRAYPEFKDLSQTSIKYALKILGEKRIPKLYIGNHFFDFIANQLHWKLARNLQYLKQKYIS